MRNHDTQASHPRNTGIGAGFFPVERRWAWIPILALAVATAPAAGESEAVDNAACLRCHAMTTLAYRDPGTGDLIDLAIDPHSLAHSAHRELACVDCHEGGFERYPHPEDAAGRQLSCLGCHERHDDALERVERFKTINTEYERSAHALSESEKTADFNCHSCHDPHRFRASAVGEDIAAIVRDDNRVCLSCHAALRDPLTGHHAWLPNRDKHWDAVRCLDCHTPLSDTGELVSHRILTAEDSNRDCVSCHSREPRLLDRLYRYRSEEDLANRGWLDKAVFNDAYVVGMSRSPLLDRLSLLVIGLTLLVLAAHGYGRYRAYRRTKGDQS